MGKNRLIVLAVLVISLLAFASSAFAAGGNIAFGIEQDSIGIADVNNSIPTYGPGQNIVMDEGGPRLELNVVYTIDDYNGEVAIGYKWSSDAGLSWTHRVILAVGDYDENGASMAVVSGSNRWHYVWEGNSSSSSSTYGKIYYMEWSGSPQIINSTSVVANSNGSSVAADTSGGVHVSYSGRKNGIENGVYYSGSTDSGESFTLHETIGVCTVDCGHAEPVITVDENGNPLAAYHNYNGTSNEMRFAWRTGSNWNSVDIDDGGYGSPQRPSIAANGGNICIAWYVFSPARAVIASCSTDSGSTWDTRKVADGNYSYRPNIAIDSTGTSSIIWSDSVSGGNFLKFSRFSANKWSTPQIIVTGYEFDGGIEDPKMTLDSNGKAYIIYSAETYNGNTMKFTMEK